MECLVCCRAYWANQTDEHVLMPYSLWARFAGTSLSWRLSLAACLALLGASVGPARGPEVSRAAQDEVRRFTLFVRDGVISGPDGSSIYVWGFTDDPNGRAKIPGPVIEANEGDTVEV